MSVIAHFSVPAEQFPLGAVLEVRQGVKIRLDSMIPTGDAIIPYFWVETDDAAAIERALEESSLVDGVHILDTVDEETLFRVEWSTDVNGLVDVLGATDAAILEGRGQGDNWWFRTRFPDHNDLSTFYRSCTDQGLTVELHGLYNERESPSANGYGLTDDQREALTIALEAGYFAVPRQITLVELAERLGISDSAASQRVRRGLKTLLTRTFRSAAEHD